MINSTIDVWGIGTFRTFRVYWILEEFNLNYTVHPIRTRTGEANTEEYRKINVREKIPTLVHNSFVLSESAAIVSYISQSFDKPPDFYLPSELKEQHRILEWNYFGMTELDATAIYVLRRHEGPPYGLSHIYGSAPTANDAAREYFDKQLNAMEGLLGDQAEYLCGGQFSAADIIMISNLDCALLFEIKLSPRWMEYRDKVIQRPSYGRAVAVNYPVRSSE